MPQHSKQFTGHNNSDTIANQVFLGMPWKLVRPKYERAVDKLKKSYPLPSSLLVAMGHRMPKIY